MNEPEHESIAAAQRIERSAVDAFLAAEGILAETDYMARLSAIMLETGPEDRNEE